jgi:hypothetical protein
VTDLVLERQGQDDLSLLAPGLYFTPPMGADYWRYRVRVAEGQAVVGFPKFGVVGVGFADEEDGDESSWNTNLPSRMDAESIRRHIWCNRGRNLPDTPESKALVVAAIELIQQAVEEDA